MPKPNSSRPSGTLCDSYLLLCTRLLQADLKTGLCVTWFIKGVAFANEFSEFMYPKPKVSVTSFFVSTITDSFGCQDEDRTFTSTILERTSPPWTSSLNKVTNLFHISILLAHYIDSPKYITSTGELHGIPCHRYHNCSFIRREETSIVLFKKTFEACYFESSIITVIIEVNIITVLTLQNQVFTSWGSSRR